MSSSIARRTFLGAVGGGLVVSACGKSDDVPKGPRPGAPSEGDVALPPAAVAAAEMPTRELGKTGVRVSLVGLGGFHIGIPKEDAEAQRIIRSAIDRGVTFLDNCWDYHDGKSEERVGRSE